MQRSMAAQEKMDSERSRYEEELEQEVCPLGQGCGGQEVCPLGQGCGGYTRTAWRVGGMQSAQGMQHSEMEQSGMQHSGMYAAPTTPALGAPHGVPPPLRVQHARWNGSQGSSSASMTTPTAFPPSSRALERPPPEPLTPVCTPSVPLALHPCPCSCPCFHDPYPTTPPQAHALTLAELESERSSAVPRPGPLDNPNANCKSNSLSKP